MKGIKSILCCVIMVISLYANDTLFVDITLEDDEIEALLDDISFTESDAESECNGSGSIESMGDTVTSEPIKPLHEAELKILGFWQSKIDGSEFYRFRKDRTFELYGQKQLAFKWMISDDSLYVYNESDTSNTGHVVIMSKNEFRCLRDRGNSSFIRPKREKPLYPFDPLGSSMQYLFKYEDYLGLQWQSVYKGNELSHERLLGEWILSNIHDDRRSVFTFTEEGEIKKRRKTIGSWKLVGDTLNLYSTLGVCFPLEFSVDRDSLKLISGPSFQGFTRKVDK